MFRRMRTGLRLLAAISGPFIASAEADAAAGAAGTDAVHIATLAPLGAVCPQGFMEASPFAKRLKELGYDPPR